MAVKSSARRPNCSTSTFPEAKRAQEDLFYTIHLTKRVAKSASEATSFKSECAQLVQQTTRLSQLLRSTIRLITTSSSTYSPPIHHITTDLSRNLQLALTLTRNCRRNSFLRLLIMVNKISPTDFRQLTSLLDTSVTDLRWLLSIFNSPATTTSASTSSSSGRDTLLSLPSIAITDPTLPCVWTFLATIHNTSNSLPDRIHAANELTFLALENDGNKKIIVDEDGVPALLKLLKEHTSNEAQIAAVTALLNLVDNKTEATNSVVESHGVRLIVQILNASPMKVQIKLAKLVAKMSELSPTCKEKFATENVIRPLVSLLSFETFEDEEQKLRLGKRQNSFNYPIIHHINNDITSSLNPRGTTSGTDSNNTTIPSSRRQLFSSSSFPSISHHHHNRDLERENETPELKREMKITCSEALLMLARDSITNSQRITETKGLLCLAKLVEKEDGELKHNCLMTIMEITRSAESNADLRRSGFKSNSPAAKAVVCQLLRLIEDDDDVERVVAIRSIGCLARTFSAREAARVIELLVDRLNEEDEAVVVEAVVALRKFTTADNFLCKENSKSIMEFNGVPKLVRLVKCEKMRKKLPAVMLLCCLAMYASEDEVLGQWQVLSVLKEAAAEVVIQGDHQNLKGLIARAVEQLSVSVYHDEN